MTLALFGATGAVGTVLAAALSAQATPFRAIGRSQDSLQRQFGANPLAQLATWNPDAPDSVRAALQGVDTLIYLVGVNYWEFALHPRLMRTVLDGAVAAGVRRVVLVGTVYVYGKTARAPITEAQPKTPHTFKGAMRLEQEQLLMDYHRAGKLEASVLRLPDFIGPGVDKSIFGDAFKAAASGARANLVAPLEALHQFVYVPDVAAVLLKLADTPAAYGHAWHFAGSGVITQKALIGLIEKETGRPLKVMAVGRHALRFLGLFSPLMREVAEMHYLVEEPLVMDDTALTTLLGPLVRTPYVEAVRACLAAAQRAHAPGAATSGSGGRTEAAAQP